MAMQEMDWRKTITHLRKIADETEQQGRGPLVAANEQAVMICVIESNIYRVLAAALEKGIEPVADCD